MPRLASLNFDRLVAPVHADSPSGDDLEYDARFCDLERFAQGKEEQQFGATVIDAEPPDWLSVRELALELCQRTHDLRVGVYLAESVIGDGGFDAFGSVLDALTAWVREEWDTVHPLLDPADDRDPTLRVNVLARLIDADRVLARWRHVALLEERGLGRFTLGAATELADHGHADSATPLPLEAALAQFPVEPLMAVHKSLQRTARAVADLSRELEQQVGVQNSVEFQPLYRLFQSAAGLLDDRLQRRGVATSAEVPSPAAVTPVPGDHAGPSLQITADSAGQTDSPVANTVTATTHAPMAAEAPARQNAAGVGPAHWQIRERHEVGIALDRLCEYFARHEPSSPIPLLLRRAKRLVPMSFIEILSDLAPDGLMQARMMQGDTSDGEKKTK